MVVPGPNREEGVICPIDRIHKHPLFNIAIDSSSTQEIGQIADSLKHQSPLTHAKFKLFGIMTRVSAIDGDEHKTRYYDVQACCHNSIVESLSYQHPCKL